MGAVRGVGVDAVGSRSAVRLDPHGQGGAPYENMYQFRAAAVSQSVSDETAQWRSANSRAVQSKGRLVTSGPLKPRGPRPWPSWPVP